MPRLSRTLLLSSAAFGLTALAAHAEVTVSEGATPIPDGEATAAGDLTVRNDRLAFTLAIESKAPWGVPRGAIVDLAPVREGEIGLDRVAFADFIPNNWSAWPNTSQEVEVLERTPEKAVVRAVRDFGDAAIETTYTLEAGSDRIHLVTVMTNEGDAPLTDHRSGFTLWPDSGYLFEVPGLQGLGEGSAEGALADRVTAYDADWFIALHAPYFDNVNYDTKDLYLSHTLAPGESRRFEGWLQVGASGDLAPVVEAEIERKGLPAGEVSGSVRTASGEPVPGAVVVVEKEGQSYAWTLADAEAGYDLKLPAGEYSLYATAEGYSESAPETVSVTDGAETSLDFVDLKAPGTVSFTVSDAKTGQPLDARIRIAEGQAPFVEFLGRKTFFTSLEEPGSATLTVAPGDYVFKVAHGEGVLGAGEDVAVTVEPDASQQAEVALDLLARPAAQGWYASDMHHHADQLEGVTPPEDVARAELAAGLDLLFVSDHDSTINHDTLAEIAEMRGVPFIPSVEFSSSWGHFNAYPLDLGEPLQIDTTTATVQEVLAEARRLGAEAIQANHPFIPYGYLASLEAGTVPGGFTPAFDLLEMNGPEDDAAVFERASQLWNGGHRYYLSAGSDAHDVWNDDTGSARAYVHVPGELSAEGFVANLKAGHAYVTRGPLIRPSVMFGDDIEVAPGSEVELGFDLKAVAGLKEIRLVRGGEVVGTRGFEEGVHEAGASFTVSPEKDAWFAVTVEDAEGGFAYSNPIWIDTVTPEDMLPAK